MNPRGQDRFPLSGFAVPVVCLLLLAAVGWFLREGGGLEEAPSPGLRLLCEASLLDPLTEIAAAFERRGGGKVEIGSFAAGDPAITFGEDASHDLWIFRAETSGLPAGIPPELLGQEIEGLSPTLRVFSGDVRESFATSADFVEFLTSSFAAGILERFGRSR